MLDLVRDRDRKVFHGNAALPFFIPEQGIETLPILALPLARLEEHGGRNIGPVEGRFSEDCERVLMRERHRFPVRRKIGHIDEKLTWFDLEARSPTNDEEPYPLHPRERLYVRFGCG